MTASDSLIIERPSDEIVVLKINRPQVRNALKLTCARGSPTKSRAAAPKTPCAA